jgi:hypothetical protein
VAIFGGRYFAGIDSTGDEFVTDGKGTKGRVLDDGVANHSGEFVSRAHFRSVTFVPELAITDPSSGEMKASFQNCRTGGMNVADRLYIGNPSTQRVLLEPNGLDVSNAATPDTQFRMFNETRTVAGGEWQQVFDQPMTQGSGQVYIVSRGGQGPALHARLTRATGEEKADQMSVLQDQNAADGGKIEMRWLAGKSPEFRVNGTGKIVVEIVSESMGH